MITAATIFWGFVFPGLLVAAGLLLAGRVAIGGVLVAIGFAVAFWSLRGPAGFPPTNAVQWLFWLAAPVGILSAIDSFLKPPIWLRSIFLLLLLRISLRTILAPLVPASLSSESLEMWIDIGSLIALLSWLSIEDLAERASGPTAAFVLAILCFGIGILVATTLHIQQEGEIGISLAIMSAAAGVAAAWNRKIAIGRGTAQAVILLVLPLLAFGWFYSDDTLSTSQQIRAGILLAAPLAAFIGDIPGIRKFSPRIRFVLRLATVGLIVGALSGMSIADYVHTEHAAAMQGEE
jgi:hypothetical protein